MALSLYNTLTKRKEEFRPLRERHVGLYVCGPTVYGDSHLGHAKSYISFDVIVRYLRFLGFDVLYVQNITDVGHLLGDANDGEDRILKAGRAEHKHPMQIAETYTRSFFEDMDRLNVLRPDISPRATGHIVEQIGLIQSLLDRKLAYEAAGSVYFDVGKFPAYGKLSGRSVEELVAGARVEVKTEKRHPADFALWKKAEPEHIMRWPSPWGTGFPGWHIECSAMSMKYLGDTFDIHGGGLENQFPHHECEIAQSEGATGKPFVRYWLHNNMVTVDGRKMGKSLGNFTTLKDAFKKWDPQVIRFFILQSHYRSTLDFSDAAMEGAAKGLERLMNAWRNIRERAAAGAAEQGAGGPDIAASKSAFLAAMDDDFNTPQAIAVLFDFARDMNQLLAGGAVPRAALVSADALLEELAGGILGLAPAAPEGGALKETALVELLLALRSDIRAQKLWALSDKIRDGLAQLGVAVEDKKDGTSWKKTF